jgi:hypothetical protein
MSVLNSFIGTVGSLRAGGTVDGDLTISGDLTVSGGGSYAYSEVLTGDMSIDRNASGDSAENGVGLYVDFDRTVASAGTAAHNDIGINLDVNSASLGTSSVIGMDIDVVGAASGTSTATGLTVDVGSADTNYAALFNGGNVGIGNVAPAALLSVGTALTSTSDAAIIISNNASYQGEIGYSESSNTRMWFNNTYGNVAATMEFRMADTTKMILLNSGNVGIGVTDPDHTLEVFSTAAQLKLSYDADSFATFAVDASDDVTIKTAASGGFRFQATTDTIDYFQVLDADGGTAIFNVDATNERVGIGTTTVDTPLHIEKSVTSTNNLTFGIKMEDPVMSGDDHLGILFSGRTDNAGGKAYIGFKKTGNYGVGDIVFYNDAVEDDNTVTVSDNVMVFNKSGNVGIGESSPDELLHLTSGLSGKPTLILENTNADASGPTLKLMKSTTSEEDGDEIGNISFTGMDDAGNLTGYALIRGVSDDVTNGSEDGSLHFFTRVNDSSSQRLSIVGGNVGIGETNPTSPSSIDKFLHISSSSHAGIVLEDTGDSSAFDIWAEGASLRFAYSNTRLMTIESSGKLSSTHTGNSVSFLLTNSHATEPYGMYIDFSNASPDNNIKYFIYCNDSTTSRMIVYSNGDVQNRNNSYGAISDKKLKQNIKNSSSQWDDVKALSEQVKNFRFKSDVKQYGQDAEYRLGFVAQDIEEISPHLVRNNPDTEEVEVDKTDEDGNVIYKTEQNLVSEAVKAEFDEDGNEVSPAQEAVYETVTLAEAETEMSMQETGEITKSVKYSIAYMKAFKALGEAMERIEQLEAKVVALENA